MKKHLLFSIGIAIGISGVYAQSVPCGNAANPFTILRPSQNQVAVNTDLNTVIFFHRQDPALHGESGTSGKYRYSISTDGGLTFTENVGVVNPTYTRAGRYPNMVIHNPAGNTNPENAFMVWAGPTLQPSLSGWDGHVNGVTQISLTAPTGSETYQFQGSQNGLPGGLTERVSGEFWLVENPIRNDSNVGDSVFVYKGIYDNGNNTVAWTKLPTISLPVDKQYDGVGRATSPNIAFSPNGQIGYIALTGDLIGGEDTIYQPIVIKSTDGGVTWGSPTEIQINTIPGVLDTMQALVYDDGQGGLIQITTATTSFDFDITVDANGNLHYFTTICTAEAADINTNANFSDKQYSVYPGFIMYAADITSSDGGSTWMAKFVSPVNSFRTEIGTLSVDNQPQVSRNNDGTRIFFSWTDTDTLLAGPTTDNTLPNLRVAGLRISDGFQTCYKRVEDVSIDDQVIAPTMAPTVLETFGTVFTLPIVATEIIVDENTPVNFHYMGNKAKICEEDFQDPATLDFRYTFTGGCYSWPFCSFLGVEEEVYKQDVSVFPNPASTQLNLDLSGVKEDIQFIRLTDLMGKVVLEMSGSSLTEGQTLVNLDIANLSNGIYSVNVLLTNSTISKKVTITK